MKFQVKGMNCANCANKIEKSLNNKGYDSTINLATEIANVEISSEEEIVDVMRIIKDTGYEVKQLGTAKTTLTISGMNCANCVNKIRNGVNDLVINQEISLATNQGYFLLKDGVTKEDLVRKIKSLGFEIEEDMEESKIDWTKIKLIVAISASVYFIFKMIVMHFLKIEIPIISSSYLDLVVATFVQILIGTKYYKDAYIGIKVRSYGMDFLVATSTTIAYIYSIYLLFFTNSHFLFFEIQVILISVIYLGNYIEDKIKEKSRKNLKKLLDLHIKKAIVQKEDILLEKDVEFIEKDELLIVKAGEQIALDGVITKGESLIDESLLTGEEQGISKKIGDKVLAGTFNLQGIITVKVLRKSNETYLSNIITQVESLSESKPKIQQIGDKIVKIFVPVIFLIATLTFIIWLIGTQDLNAAIYAGLATLVIACPCALGLATPLTFMIGNSKLYQNQLLVKDIGQLMEIEKIKTIALDKTGTITQKVVKVMTGNIDDQELLTQVASIEKMSYHPMAKAITSYLEARGVQTELINAREIKGYGMEFEDIQIGSIRLVEKNKIKTDDLEQDAVYVIKDGKIVLQFSFTMELKEENIKALNKLAKIYDLILITGDRKEATQNVTNKIKFKEVFSEVLPEDKGKIIEELEATGEKVMYVGDGINDTLALSRATLGIAINNEVDAVKEIADVVLIENDFTKIEKLYEISRRIKNNVYQNYFWAFSYNVIAIPLAVTGNLNPLVAGIMMSVSSLLVVLNANRLQLIR